MLLLHGPLRLLPDPVSYSSTLYSHEYFSFVVIKYNLLGNAGNEEGALEGGNSRMKGIPGSMQGSRFQEP